MKTSEEIAKDFKEDLELLLFKYNNAELEAKDHYSGYSECGEDVRMTVTVPAKWDSNNIMISDYTEIDLGNWFRANKDFYIKRDKERGA